MKKMSLVPALTEAENVAMFCNYARREPYEQRCLTCKEQCEHAGKQTIIMKMKSDNEKEKKHEI